jgi:hypothetical protein
VGCTEEAIGSNGSGSKAVITEEAQNQSCRSEADGGGYAETMGTIQGKESDCVKICGIGG